MVLQILYVHKTRPILNFIDAMAAQAYRRVPSVPIGTGTSSSRESVSLVDSQRRKDRSAMAAKVSDKIHAAFWVGLGIFTIVQSSLIPTMLNDPTVHRLFFNLAVICFTINCVLLGYLAVYLPCMRVTTPWDIYCPRVIPTVTIIFLVGGGCMMKALWPGERAKRASLVTKECETPY